MSSSRCVRRATSFDPPSFDITPVTQWTTTNLLPDLTCSICLDLFTDPVALPCGHIMCKECWESVENFKCPMCRTSCTHTLVVNKVLKTLVGVVPVNMQCGFRLLKAHQATHVEGCAVCLAHETKTMKSQLARTRKKLLRLRRKRAVIESESSSESEDEI